MTGSRCSAVHDHGRIRGVGGVSVGGVGDRVRILGMPRNAWADLGRMTIVA